MKRRKLILGGVGAVILGLVVAGGGLWYFFLRDTAPPPASLDAALNGLPGAGSSTAATDPTGTWSVAPGASTFAGYRVNENLAAFGARTAVGRTSAVTGSLVYDGKSITAVQLTADLSQLRSDQPLRDDTIKMSAIQSCTYPNATFDLTTPIQLSVPADGTAVTKTVQGNLTLHGVTKAVSLDVKGQLQNGDLVLVGSTDIVFADYEIEQPRSLYVVSLDDHGTMEFQLAFTKTSAATTLPATATPAASPTAIAGCSFPGGGNGGPPPNFTPGAGRPGGGFPPPSGTPGAGGPNGGNGGQPGGGFPGINTPAPVPSPVS